MMARMTTARPTRTAVMMASSIADAPRSFSRTARRSLAACAPRKARTASALSAPASVNRFMTTPLSGVKQRLDGRVHEEDQEGARQHHLRHQHRLGPLPRLPLEIGELAPAQADRAGGQRFPDLRAVLGDQAQRGGKVLQLTDLHLFAEHAERLPRGLAG